jgi:inorganic pyrophosphatase
MADLARLDHALDEETSTCSVSLIQARPMPTRSFAETRMTSSDLTALLPKSANFTLHLGLVPATRTRSGAPLDILVLGEAPPSEPLVRVRLIGVLESDRTEKGRTHRTDHVVAVVEGSPLFKATREIADLGDERLDALSQAWSAYNRQRMASFQVVASTNAAEAVRLIDQCRVREGSEPAARSMIFTRGDNA